MSAKSFAKGSTPPPSRESGVLRLYSMRFCPFAKRARLVLAAKKIPYETVNVNLDAKPEWYLDMYPSGKVPLLEGDGVIISESLIIAEYLDAAYPGEKLTPTDPYERAKEKMFLEITFSKVLGMVFKVFGMAFKSPEKVKEAFSDSGAIFFEMEEELKKKNTPFFGGNKPSMLDLMMWPSFELLSVGHLLYGEELNLTSVLPAEKFPLMNRWIEELLKYPAVKELYNPKNLGLFLESAKSQKRGFDGGDFDVGL